MTNEQKNVPELRFPEFEEEWEEKSLDDISNRKSEKNKNNVYTETFTNSAEYGIISQNDYFDKKISNEKNLDNYYIVEPDDFVYNPRISNFAPVGPINRNKLSRTGVMSPLYTIFSIKISNKEFLEYYFKTTKWHHFMKLNGDSGARSDRFTIKQSLFVKMPIYIPSNQEQEKIGDFFSKLDRQIKLEEQKLELLEQQKKGYMQKIFSQELRFKDESGNEYPEWKYSYLGDYINSYNEKTTVNNQYPVLTSSREGLFLQKDYFTRDVASKDNTGYNVVPYGYFTYRHMSDDLVFKFNINYIVSKGIVSTLYPVFSTNDYLDNYFLQELLNNGIEFKKYALMQKQGGSRTYMYFNKLKKLKLHLPSIEEQYKIGNFLYKFDNLVEKQSSNVELLKRRKQGLLQKMFI